MLTSEQVNERVKRVIAQTDWEHYHKKVGWHLQVPICHFYEGEIICPYWQSWIKEGKDLFPENKEGRKELMSNIVEHAVRPGYDHYPQTKEELEKRCQA